MIHQRRGLRPGRLSRAMIAREWRRLPAAVLLAIACGAVAHAESRKLTLEEAVSLATQHNSAVKIAGDKVKAMDARVHERGRATSRPW